MIAEWSDLFQSSKFLGLFERVSMFSNITVLQFMIFQTEFVLWSKVYSTGLAKPSAHQVGFAFARFA